MLRVQSEKNISELSNKLAMAAEEESRCKDREATLRLQLIHLQEVRVFCFFINFENQVNNYLRYLWLKKIGFSSIVCLLL